MKKYQLEIETSLLPIKDYFVLTISYLESTPLLDSWPECRHLLIRMMTDDEPWVVALPILTCKAVAGSINIAIPVAAAWSTLRYAGDLFDDVQDGDFGYQEFSSNPSHAISYATALIFVAFQLLSHAGLKPDTAQNINSIISSAGYRSVLGQFLEQRYLSEEKYRSDSLEWYWDSVIHKSGSIFQAGASCGAAIGTSEKNIIQAMSDFGNALGVIRQVLDDCADIRKDIQNLERPATLPYILRDLMSTYQENPRDKGTEYDDQSSWDALGIPEVIASILMEWRRRGLESLELLEPSSARSLLAVMLEPLSDPN